MLEFNEQHKSVLTRYSRPVVHMRYQVKAHRFGLVFGSGLSKAFGIPTWEKLVKKLADDPDIQGESILETIPPHAGLPYKTEMLFQNFKKRSYAKVTADRHYTRLLDFAIAADWREIMRKHLYARIENEFGTSLEAHPFLNQYIPLIEKTHMTVTYNFDDFIEQSLLQKHSPSEEFPSRGFETITDPWTQFRRPTANIYHPNGVVPQNALEAPSDRLVFSEASYAEQLMGIFYGDQTGLLNHLSKHTCLFIGLSLEDETLRNVLIQGARSCPGNFHYYVRHLKPGESLDEETRQAITLANFKVYNLVTLFLDDSGIRALGELIDVNTCKSDNFCDFANQHGIPVRFRFYITGPLGVGKSSALNKFRNLIVIDEWLEQRLPVLAKGWDKLEGQEKTMANEWIADQFRIKNDILRNGKEGIFAMDRGPLDPLSFTSDEEWKSKAARLLEKLCPDKAQWKVEDGRVIILQGDGEELALRMVLTKRTDYTAKMLDEMEDKLAKAYGSDGVTLFDTRGLTTADITRRIAEIVHLEDYDSICDLHKRLQDIEKGGADAVH